MITYLKGDATRPTSDGPKVIMHICNSAGGWGAGFVLALSRRWPEPERQYREWYRSSAYFALGNVGWAKVEPELWVANMIAQAGYGSSGVEEHDTGEGSPPIRYEALRSCLVKVAKDAREMGASIHAPRIGCDLAGGSWAKVEALIQETMGDLQVYVYDFPGGRFNP